MSPFSHRWDLESHEGSTSHLHGSLSQSVTPRPGQPTLKAAVHRGPQTGGGPQQREKRPGHRGHCRSSPRIGAASEILH